MKRYFLFFDFIDSLNNCFKNNMNLTTEFLYFPSEIPEKYINKRSFFHLLFDENYDHDNFIYTFSSFNINLLPSNIINRLYSRGKYIDCMVADETSGYNVLELNDEELNMLNNLLTFKNTFTYPLNDISFEDLTSDLSKLIYLHIELLGNKNKELKTKIDKILDFNMDTSNIINLIYYSYLLDRSHKYISNTNIIIDSSMIETYFFKVRINLNKDYTDENEPIIFNNCPTPVGEMYLYYKGNIIENTKYTIEYEDKNLYVYSLIPFYKNDNIILEYLTNERVNPEESKKINNIISTYTAIHWR